MNWNNRCCKNLRGYLKNNFRIHPAGHIFILIPLVLAILVAILGSGVLFLIFLFLTVLMVVFFRSPRRKPPEDLTAVVAPADGLVVSVTEVKEVPEHVGIKAPCRRVSIFLSVFNVHVNRIPVGGVVEKISYHKGRFLSALDEESSFANEQKSYLIATSQGEKMAFVQIAGTIARRIVSKLKSGDKVSCGEIMGIIRFGSRVDVYIPLSWPTTIVEGQHTLAGETILAHMPVLKKTRSASTSK